MTTPSLYSIAGQVQVAQAAGPEGSKSEQRRVKFVPAYAGDKFRGDDGRDHVIDLDGLQIEDQERPILWRHDLDRQGGHTIKVWDRRGQLFANGVIMATTQAGRDMIRRLDDGMATEASIGVDPMNEVSVGKGQTRNVNGRELEGPFVLATSSRLVEISMTPASAAQGSRIDPANQSSSSRKESAMATHSTSESANDKFQRLISAEMDKGKTRRQAVKDVREKHPKTHQAAMAEAQQDEVTRERVQGRV